MPHFMARIAAQGPVVPAAVMISGARRQALEAAGLPIPIPQQIVALIDTGASFSGIDPGVLQALGLSPTGEIEIHTPSTGGTPVKCDTYDVVIGIFAARPGDLPFISETIQISATVLTGLGIQALIGRDILKRCIFSYNGADGYITLAY